MLAFLPVWLASGLVTNGLRLMTGKNGSWVAMPSQKQLDREGKPRLEADGKPIFNQIVEFRDRATADRFNAMVLDLVRAEHPGAFDESPPTADERLAAGALAVCEAAAGRCPWVGIAHARRSGRGSMAVSARRWVAP